MSNKQPVLSYETLQDYAASMRDTDLSGFSWKKYESIIQDFLNNSDANAIAKYAEDGDKIVPVPLNDLRILFIWIGLNGAIKGIFGGANIHSNIPNELMTNGIEVQTRIELKPGHSLAFQGDKLILKGENDDSVAIWNAIRKQLLLVMSEESRIGSL